MAKRDAWRGLGDVIADLAGAPSPSVQDMMLKQLGEKLAAGIPVTLTCNGKRLTTYYPDGSVENHHEL